MYMLDNMTYIYRQNGIDYSVKNMHEQLMRMLAPPMRLLGLDDQ